MVEQMRTGYVPRDYKDFPLGSVPYTVPFDLEIIPESEWKERIDFLNAERATVMHVQEACGIKALSQGDWGYCWAYGTVQAYILMRAAAGLPYKHINPHALAAQVKHFQDQGGNTWDAIPWLTEHGCPTFNTWPDHSTDRALATSKVVKDEAIKYRLTEHYELEPNSVEQMATCLLNGIPVISGWMDLGHMMCAEAMLYRERNGRTEYGVALLNSWGPDSGDQHDGRMYRWGSSKIKAFDMAAPRVSTVNV